MWQSGSKAPAGTAEKCRNNEKKRDKMGAKEFASLLGGLALFLYGMNMMSQGMEAAAGNKMKQILERLTTLFFAFTTILGWDYYSERCLEYLTNGKKKCIKAYRWVYILCVFIGPYMTVSAVWTIADIFNGLMAIPNLIALVALNGVVAKETKDYLDRIKKKEID